jgi:hypothetical protein
VFLSMLSILWLSILHNNIIICFYKVKLYYEMVDRLMKFVIFTKYDNYLL